MKGMGVLECQWSPHNNTITLRGEDELGAMSHYCLKKKGRDGRQRETSIKMIIHCAASDKQGKQASFSTSSDKEGSHAPKAQHLGVATGLSAQRHQARKALHRGAETARNTSPVSQSAASMSQAYPARARTSGDEGLLGGGLGAGDNRDLRGSLTSRPSYRISGVGVGDAEGGGRGGWGGAERASNNDASVFVRWLDVGPLKPAKGVEIINVRLSTALSKKLAFTQREFEAFFECTVPQLTHDTYIKISAASKTGQLHYMKPDTLSCLVVPQTGGTDFLNHGAGCVISLQERQDVLAACGWLQKLLSHSRTPMEAGGREVEGGTGGERPTLKTILAHFKRSYSGPVMLIWASAILSIPSELVIVRSLEQSDPHYAGLLQVLLICVIECVLLPDRMCPLNL